MKLPIQTPAAIGRSFIQLGREVATTILRTIESGWALALQSQDVNPNALEIPITERLRDGMRRALDTGKLPWGNTMVVLPGTESRSGPEVLVPDGRTDIPILLIKTFIHCGEHDPHAIIECKRVAGNNAHLCREYVVEGINRFTIGRYASNHSTGFMVGYLLSGDADAAVAGINRNLNRASRHAENLDASSLLREPWARRSRHPREIDDSPIELHHAFLAFVSQ